MLAQTFSDFELIIVDDGSTDDTKEIVAEIYDGRIRFIHQENGGGSKARNIGIDAATGKFIAFLDSDDLFLPNHLKNAFHVLKSGQNICTYTRVIVDRGCGVNYAKPPRTLKPNEHISDYLMRDRGFVPTSSLIVPKQLARIVKYNEGINFGQDTDYAIRLVHTGADLRMLKNFGAVLKDYWNSNRLSGKINPEERINWLAGIRPLVTVKAYRADMGWHVAKGFAENGNILKAIRLYFSALVRGCYCSKMTIVVLLQLLLRNQTYRKMSDVLAKLKIRP